MNKITQFCEPIAQSIIDSLEAADDGSKWQMPWASMEMRPYNYSTKEPYHGVNILVFACPRQEASTSRSRVRRQHAM